jgi:hypothetical protein
MRTSRGFPCPRRSPEWMRDSRVRDEQGQSVAMCLTGPGHEPRTANNGECALECEWVTFLRHMCLVAMMAGCMMPRTLATSPTETKRLLCRRRVPHSSRNLRGGPAVFWDVTPRGPLNVSRPKEEHIVFIFRVEELHKPGASMKQMTIVGML